MLLPMLLSLCILTYNRQTLLSKAIESVSMSNVLEHNRVELIILDNGSQDQTPNLLREFQSKLSFKVIREEVNMRGSLRFQQLARVAQGEWIIFLGDDDYFEVETLRQLPIILSETNAEVNMVSFAARIVDQEGRLLGDTFVPPESKSQQEIIAKLINQPIYFFPATIFRRNICEVNIQPTVFFFDWALMLLAVML
jgi:glycosyltransferase involved in cell wall biosynthesis